MALKGAIDNITTFYQELLAVLKTEILSGISADAKSKNSASFHNEQTDLKTDQNNLKNEQNYIDLEKKYKRLVLVQFIFGLVLLMIFFLLTVLALALAPNNKLLS